MFLYFASCIFLIAANYWLAYALGSSAETQAVILKNDCINYLNIQTLVNKQVLFLVTSQEIVASSGWTLCWL